MTFIGDKDIMLNNIEEKDDEDSDSGIDEKVLQNLSKIAKESQKIKKSNKFLKLKRKFPLFTVINPLKKEFRKLAYKKKEKNIASLYNQYSTKIEINKLKINYKKSYKSMLNYLCNK